MVIRVALTALTMLLAAEARADAMEPFTVTGLRVEGLQRITEGAVYNVLPVNIGDRLDARHVREALRALNATGFFNDVEMRREDPGVLIVVVRERPTIHSFEVKGNKDIKTEDLLKSLRSVDLASGKIFNRSTLEDVRQYLTEQYFARGRYGVQVDSKVDELPDNLVDVRVDIIEGKRASIRQISIVGNHVFTDKQLLGSLELQKHNLLSFYKGDDKYSKQSLDGDLEKIRSYYLDRGYADAEITSTQVALTPEKNDLFITVNVYEGKTWKISAVKLAGRFVVPREILERYLVIHPGDVFSHKLIAASEAALRDRLSDAGFAFADVQAVPLAHPETGEISLNFEIEPNQRTYVRRIDFEGVTRTQDQVLRREMRQLEGAVLSNSLVERSKERLERLPYLTKVETETNRVTGSPDQVDVKVKVEEGPSSSIGGGIGYSERESFMLQGNYIDSNVFGTGDRLAVDLNGGQYNKIFSVSHTDPYFTKDNVSLSLNAGYVERERLTSSTSQFSTETYSAGTSIGLPLTENQGINFGLTYSHEDLATVLSSSAQLRQWVRENGNSYFERVGSDPVLGTLIDTVELTAAWVYDSRNRTLFPTRGGSHRLALSVTPPGGSVEFAMANWRSQQFFRIPLPLIDKIPISLSTMAGYGKAFGDTTALPPNRHIFTGGADTVRGFKDGTLGPRDSLGNPYGGDAGVSLQLEAILPLPEKFQSSARLSLFLDAGQSYYLGDTEFRNKRGDRITYPFDLGELRSSAGIAIQWLGPMGLFRFSYAVPLEYQSDTRRVFGDQIEHFQFSVGQAF